MLFKILFVILILYAMICPYLFIKFGMKIAEKEDKKAETPIFNVPTPKKKPKLTPEQDREMQILANMARYNGTSAGQVKVEVKR